MKSLLIELRLALAEWLLGLAYDAAPEKSIDGNEIKLTVASYFERKVKEHE